MKKTLIILAILIGSLSSCNVKDDEEERAWTINVIYDRGYSVSIINCDSFKVYEKGVADIWVDSTKTRIVACEIVPRSYNK